MLKVRIIAALIAIALTVITIYLVPQIAFLYMSFVDGLSEDQQLWLNIGQAGIGGLIAVYGFSLWKKKKS